MDEITEVVVGIPTYNNEDTIGDTIEMVLAQTQTPDRIVCCDKSTDNTQDIIQSYRENNPEISIEIINQSGDGVADAYDEILNYIGSEYDLFVTLQTDLIVDKDWLSGHIDAHDEHPEIDIVTGDNKANNPTDKEVDPNERPYYVGRNFSAKEGTLESIDGWDSNFLRGEDWDMRIRLAGVGTRVYAKTDIGYEWQKEDPYITLSKAKRKPTSVTFLSKYGRWYLGFHPSHVVADTLSFTSLLSGISTVVLLPFSQALSRSLALIFILSLIVFWLGHIALRGGVDGDFIFGPIRKQLLHGIAVFYAIRRVIFKEIEWNMTGFNPENVPSYGF